jgi:CRP/FNR family transcriptional regulator, cyclic AMP receptor protein
LAEGRITASQLAQFLHSTTLFKCLPEGVVANLANSCRFRLSPKGSMVFFQADVADSLYIVYSGSIAILLTSPDGRELIINEVRPGDYFGELALITRTTRSTSALVREKSELVVIPGDTFITLLDNYPILARGLLEITAARLYESSDRESALAFLDAPARIVRLLLQLDLRNDEKGYMVLSQEELAQRTGLTRQTVAKILGRWRRAGWLLTGRGRIMLLNRPALENVERQATL